MRGYPEVERQSKSKKPTTTETKSATAPGSTEDATATAAAAERGMEEKPDDPAMIEQQEAEDYDNEKSEEEVRNVDHIVFVIHG